MAYKYLLTSGQSTTKVEEYILDLLKLYLQVNPGDIPGAERIGFDFTLLDVKKDRLQSEVEYRVKSLLKKVQERFTGIKIEAKEIVLLDEKTAKVTVEVSGDTTQDYYIDLYDQES
jgi:hypothetical protein